jgi:iron complex transport system substrate-binding protein
MSRTRTGTSTRRLKRGIAVAVPLALTAALVACGSSSTGSSAEPSGSPSSSAGSSSAAGAFPVTIKHAFGETTIDKAPTRIVTWGWGSTDAAVALGTVPVAIPKQSYGAQPDGFNAWTEEAIKKDGGTLPTLLTQGDDPPYEEIIKAKPDVILANYSGITQAQYDTLKKIAPVVAYPDQPWSTPWRDVITTVGQVLGKSDAAKTLLTSIDAQVKKAADEHPEFKGKSIAAIAVDGGTFYVYKDSDPRVEFLTDLGFTSAPSVTSLGDGKADTFFYTLSLEKVDQLTSDVLLLYSANDKAATEALGQQGVKDMAQVKAGDVVQINGEAIVSAVSPPTALSLTWGLNDFITALTKVVK